MSHRWPTSFWLLLFSGLVIGNIYVYRDIAAPRALMVEVLAAGKGNALLVRAPQGATFLIDTGSDAGILRAIGMALPQWQRHINTVLLTSVAGNTAGGLPYLLRRYHVGNVVRPAALGTKSTENSFASSADAQPDMRRLIAKRGMRLPLGGGAYADVLWPPQVKEGRMTSAEGPLVLRISYGATSFRIEKSVPARTAQWLASIDAHLPAPTVIISSTTPAGVYVSDGETITQTREPN
ncbi:MAG: ComEC/Rec2 family competence protein [Minisyncoccota bacterium]